MATTHQPAPGHPLARRVLTIIGIGIVVILVLLLIGTVFGSRDSHFPSSPTISGARVPAAPGPSASSGDGASRYTSAPRDERGGEEQFVAQVRSWADRDGFPVAGSDTMVTAGRVVCARVGAGQSVTDASSTLMVGYGFTEKEAQAVGATAVDILCPENKP